MQKRDFTAAINRFKIVVTQYQTTRHVEESCRSTSYMAIGQFLRHAGGSDIG